MPYKVYMQNEWNPRAEILTATHRWPVIVLFILVGSLVGVAVAYLLPSPYRAEASLLVAYNADVHLRNPDDYKNWQMEQLNIFILSEEVLQQTLDRLKTQNQAWSETTIEDLNDRLHVYWRNAGEWRLVAEAPAPELADEMVTTWEQVILEQIAATAVHANAVLSLATNLDNLSNQRLDLQLRATQLEQIKQALHSWIQETETAPSNEPLDTLQREFLLSRVSSLAGWHPQGIALLEAAPPADADALQYIPWLEEAVVHLEEELASIEPQTSQITSEYDQLYAAWSEELNAARGLTAFLIVEPLDQQPDPAQPTRPTSLLAFVGGLLGLLVWGLIWLARPIRQAKTSTP
jgi:uncharacterized protein involved in exopolysaccharide biosynthesis